MDCAFCQHLESERDRLERAHAERIGMMRACSEDPDSDVYRKLGAAEHDARAESRIATAQLGSHKRSKKH